MGDLMTLDFGGVALPFDQTQAAELAKGMTAGLGGEFKRSARVSMGNSGDWELIDSEGEIHDLGRDIKIVIVDQREYVSRVHYAKSYDEMKETGEFEAPDCQSYNGETPDDSVEKPYSDKCKTCTAFEKSGQKCAYYRRVVAVLIGADGTFSDPFVFEPKAVSLFDKTIVKERYGSYGWYMNVLASQKRNGVAMPIPAQAVVTHCIPMPKMDVATIKFGIAANSAGGYWALTKEQFEEILALKESEEVQDMLKPFNAAANNPSSAGRIPVKNIETDEPVAAPAVETKEETTKKAAPARKSSPAKKEQPKPKKATKQVVLGMEHPDVVNSEDYDYAELKEWASDPDTTQDDVTEFLQENFPQALEPVTVEVDEPVEPEVEPKPAKRSPPRKVSSAKKEAVEQPVGKTENVVDTSGAEVDPTLAAQANAMAETLDEFDD